MSGLPGVPVRVCGLGLRLGAASALTVRLTVAVAVRVPPVAVTVCTVADWVAVGVPLMTPVLVLSARPAGRLGAAVKLGAVVNPLGVRTDVGVSGKPWVALMVCVVGLSAVVGAEALPVTLPLPLS